MDLSNKKLRADILKEALKQNLGYTRFQMVLNDVVATKFREAFVGDGCIQCSSDDRESLIEEAMDILDLLEDAIGPLVDKRMNDNED